MKTKQIPLILMLLGGAVCSIVTYSMHYELKTALLLLLAVLVVFYIAGLVIKKVLDSFELENSKSVSDEGEVIEKQSEEDAAAETEASAPKTAEEK